MNNVMAMTFGAFVVFVLIVGSVWIMTHLNHNMIPMERLMHGGR
jgi:cytochrome o ubiquinol oxidase subunit IV